MKKLKNLPQWLVIVGQSGCGKGSVLDILSKLCNEDGIEPLFINTGEEIRQTVGLQTYFTQKMKEINNMGKRQPPLIASSLWCTKIIKKLKDGQHIIHDGSPRSPEEFELMYSLVEVGYLHSMKVLEVLAPDSICRERLIERTKRDQRLDLSMDNKPGEPDNAKIATKMAWWTDDRSEIIRRVKGSGAYLKIENTGTLEDLEKQILEIFQ